MKYDITPVPKPRMTRSDKWRKPMRPCVARYWAFKQEVGYKVGLVDLNYAYIAFAVPMPKSWNKKKRDLKRNTPHTPKDGPDLDNFLKALCDALYGNDSGIHTIQQIRKFWADKGAIYIGHE